MDKINEVFEAVTRIVSPVFLVGGSVRDFILGETPKDWDFSTPLSPDEVEAKVKAAGRHVYGIGKKFGTIGFKVPLSDGTFVFTEITTFRGETYTPGSRKPTVEFVDSLEDDLSRRDFTINAIAFDGKNFIDPFDGQSDLARGLIRSVGNPNERFAEDPLRLLRCIRFADRFGFKVDADTWNSIARNAASIMDISRERWVMELDKILDSRFRGDGISDLFWSGLLKFVLPEIFAAREFIARIRKAIEDNFGDSDEKWAVLLSFVGEGMMDDPPKSIRKEIAKGICFRLKFSNARTDTILGRFDV